MASELELEILGSFVEFLKLQDGGVIEGNPENLKLVLFQISFQQCRSDDMIRLFGKNHFNVTIDSPTNAKYSMGDSRIHFEEVGKDSKPD